MDKFNFDQLKNIEVPEECIEKALNIPAVIKRTPTRVKIYRFAAGLAACVVLAAAIGFSFIFGLNKGVDMTAPDGGSDSYYIPAATDPNAEVSSNPTEAPSNPSDKTDKSATIVIERSENSGSVNERKGTNQAVGKNNSQAADNSKSNSESEKQTDSVSHIPESTAPQNVPATESQNQTESGTSASGENDKPTRPNDPEVYGCHFLTSIDTSEAQGNQYYCKIEDESGALLGSDGLYSESRMAETYDWGNPDWPMDIRYTADFVLYYGNYYTVTFYNSKGEVVWSGVVYLQQNKSSYLFYE